LDKPVRKGWQELLAREEHRESLARKAFKAPLGLKVARVRPGRRGLSVRRDLRVFKGALGPRVILGLQVVRPDLRELRGPRVQRGVLAVRRGPQA